MTQKELKNLPDGICIKIKFGKYYDGLYSILKKNLVHKNYNGELCYLTGSMLIEARYISIATEAEIEEQYQKSLDNLKQSYKSKLKALKEYKKEVK